MSVCSHSNMLSYTEDMRHTNDTEVDRAGHDDR